MQNVQYYPEILKKLEPLISGGFASFLALIEKGMELGAIPRDIDRTLLTQELFMIVDAMEFYSAYDMKFPLEEMWEDLIKKIV